MSVPSDRESDIYETQMLRVNELCNRFEAAWRSGGQPTVEDFLTDLTGTDREAALIDLLPLEIEYRQRAGQTLVREDYQRRFPTADPAWLEGLLDGHAGGSLTSAPIPTTLGDYQILDRIGMGGMGTVYKALHVRMGRVVALKILKAEIQQNPILLQRFDREVRAAARLNHPHIVTALDAREQDGLHFLITEFINGLDLDATVRQGGPLPVATAMDCILQAAKGLDFAHRQGIIHRDIKPANLLRDQQGFVKVLDMGLARLEVEPNTTATDLTNSGMVLGTAAYMAPEQARDVRRADARSDIYSLGCTLYYLLIGRPAFSGATAIDTVLAHINEPVPSLIAANPSIPVEVEQVFSRMVAKEPADRFQSATELIAAIEELALTNVAPDQTNVASTIKAPAPIEPTLCDIPNNGDTTQTIDRPLPVTKSNHNWIWGVVSTVVVIVIAFTVWMFKSGPDHQSVVGRQALAFDGTSSYLTVPKLLPQASETYTLEAVVEPTANRLGNVISWLGPDWMALYHSDGYWGLARSYQGEPHLVQSVQPSRLNTIVHLAGVYRGSTLRLYVDGQPVETKSVQFAMTDTSGGLCIGGVPPNLLPADQNQRFFEGRIHAVRISRGIRYTAAFAAPRTFRADERTIALYYFHAGKGSVVNDASGNQHNAEIHAADWVSTDR